MSTTAPGLVFKIQIDKISPPVWRSVEVPPGLTLGQLHAIIQCAMGWHGSHLHSFEIGGCEYGTPFEDDFFEGVDENKTKLETVFRHSISI